MAATTTVHLPPDVTEAAWAELLGREFDAHWFTAYHRCSIDSDDGVVYVDYAAECTEPNPETERRPGTVAVHITPSAVHPGSAALAEAVARTLGHLAAARSPVAA